jgi:hypothetical protein
MQNQPPTIHSDYAKIRPYLIFVGVAVVSIYLLNAVVNMISDPNGYKAQDAEREARRSGR